MAILSGVKARIHEVRERRPLIDHLVRMVEHYGDVNGSALAAAVTYFAFLSFFPILALAFAIFGQVTKVYKNAQDTLLDAANSVLPNLIGGENGISPRDPPGRGARHLQRRHPARALLGPRLALRHAPGAGRGLRGAQRDQPSFVKGKVRDVLALLDPGFGARRSASPCPGVATKVLTPILDCAAARHRRGRLLLVVLAIAVGHGGQHPPLLRLLPPPRRARGPDTLALVRAPCSGPSPSRSSSRSRRCC